MSESESGFAVNFFKPKTDHAKVNMRMVLIMLVIWRSICEWC
jgi:hypothetical protein